MLIQIAQFLLGLSLLIVLHELGHFIPAKIFKTRVEKFYLFFDYKFSLIKKKYKGTTYGIGWIPLGGYVKISGMVDESMDTEGLSKDPEPWEFRAKPAWQRLIILTGGVIVNFILAIVIYSGMMAYYGETYLETENVKYGMAFNDQLEGLGLQDGDVILSVGENTIERTDQLNARLIVGIDQEVVVNRGGEVMSFTMTDSIIGDILDEDEPRYLALERFPFVIDSLSPDAKSERARAAGLRVGDSLVEFNGESALFYDQISDGLFEHKGDTVQLGLYRGTEYVSTRFYVDSTGTMGVYTAKPMKYLDYTHTTYSGTSAISAGWNKSINTLDSYIQQIKVIFNPNTGAVKKLGGFKTMMEQYEENEWNWSRFWGVTAFISIMLGFLNILPIPALDGGHVLFTLIEMATGKTPSLKILEYAQIVGFFLLLTLLIYANLNDFGIWDVFRN